MLSSSNILRFNFSSLLFANTLNEQVCLYITSRQLASMNSIDSLQYTINIESKYLFFSNFILNTH